MAELESSKFPETVHSQNFLLSNNQISIHLLIIWLLTLVFCWKVFPAIFTTNTSASSPNTTTDIRRQERPFQSPVDKSDHARWNNSHLSTSTLSPPSPPSGKSKHKQSILTPNKKLVSQLQLEACAKAKEAGKHPSYVALVLNLVHHYSLDVNEPVLANSFTIFHCSCLSGSLELVSSLLPMADVHRLTDHGDSPLYLAVYAAAYKASKSGGQSTGGIEVVEHLLQAGSHVNQANLAGFTALHQASRLSCTELVRMLLDWGADQQVGVINRAERSTRNMSIITRHSSVMTRSMTSMADGLNKSRKVNKTPTTKK